MALKATIYKATISLSDMDRNYYDELNLTIAQHPSESEKRMMIRLVAFILNAQERLEFTKGLSEEGEPELWLKSYSDEIELWVDLGLPDEKRLKQASHKAKQVLLYTYGDNATQNWWQQNRQKLARFENLSVLNIADEQIEPLTAMVKRTMHLQATIQDGQLWLSNDETSNLVEVVDLARA